MTQARSVSVCVCTRHRPAELERTLRSVAESTIPVGQVVVSDDGHDGATEAVCRSAPVPVVYVRGPQRGLGPNRNHALTRVTGRCVVFLDDDCLLLPTYLEAALECMLLAERTHGEDRVIVSGGEFNHGTFVTAHEQSFLGYQRRPYEQGERRRSIVINATLFPMTVFADLRFDPQIVYGGEEIDLATRATASGFETVQCDAAANDHRPSLSSREDYDLHVDANRMYVTAKRYLLTDRQWAKAALFLLIAPAHAIASGAKREGLPGAWKGGRSVALFIGKLWAARRLDGGAFVPSRSA